MKFNFIKLKFVPRDFWVGVYIERPMRGTYIDTHAIYICLIPMFPIQICWSIIK